MVKCCLVVCVLLFFINPLKTQAQTGQKRLDSLLAVNESHVKEDSTKLVIYNLLYRQYIRLKNKPKVDEFLDKSIFLAQKLNLKWYEAEAYNRKGRGFHGAANYQKAAEFYEKAIAAFTVARDMGMVAGMYLNLGALYQAIPDYAKSLEMSQKAMLIFQENGDNNNLGSVYFNIAAIYQELGQFSNALNYFNKSLKIFKDGQITRGIAVAYNSIGSGYMNASDEELLKVGINSSQRYEIALENLNTSLKVALPLNDESVLGPLFRDLGAVYEKLGRREPALQSYIKAIDYSNSLENKTDYAFALISLAHFYMEDKVYDRAIISLNEALKIGEKDQTLDVQKNAYQLLSTIEERRGNYNASLDNYKKYIKVRDLIFNAEKEREITRKQLQIDFAVKEKGYQLKQQVTDGALQRQVLLAKQQQQKLILRQQALDLSDKEKRLQRLTFLKKQADLENEKRFQQGMRAREQLKSKLDKEIKDREINFQKSELRFNKNITAFLSVLAIILLGSAIAIFFAQRKTAKLNAIVSEQKAELEKLGGVKDRIFSVVGHDMRTPVNSLISFIQLLEDGNMDSQKLNRYAGQLKNTLTYTSAMMENLLNWASSQMEGFKPIIEPFDCNICAQDVIDSLADIAKKKNIKITNKLQSTRCLADVNMTALVLRNLINNSIKFTNENGLITIFSKEDGNHLSISIEDNGIGLAQDQIDSFNQAGFDENAKTTLGTNKEKGTGIGLMLCRTFTQLMNGSLHVRSQKNIGTTFTLRLPKAV
ncbi:MAG: tetratricopeptide repeat protein [Chitinophagaceae bacterium]|nr:MAG: tetratricopeptide repeat protein [Chitinophagaceae bacterium]